MDGVPRLAGAFEYTLMALVDRARALDYSKHAAQHQLHCVLSCSRGAALAYALLLGFPEGDDHSPSENERTSHQDRESRHRSEYHEADHLPNDEKSRDIQSHDLAEFEWR
jgi:hypothetical protein